jgi:CBS domain-containing protein
MGTTVAQILKQKPSEAGSVYSVPREASVFEAISLMAEKSIGALLVMDGAGIAGIVTERDYARKVALRERSSKTTRVEEIMTPKVIYVEPGQTSDECMALMTKHHVRHLPVLDDARLIGLISIGDLVKSVIAEQQFTIQQLEHYIHGSLVEHDSL